MRIIKTIKNSFLLFTDEDDVVELSGNLSTILQDFSDNNICVTDTHILLYDKFEKNIKSIELTNIKKIIFYPCKNPFYLILSDNKLYLLYLDSMHLVHHKLGHIKIKDITTTGPNIYILGENMKLYYGRYFEERGRVSTFKFLFKYDSEDNLDRVSNIYGYMNNLLMIVDKKLFLNILDDKNRIVQVLQVSDMNIGNIFYKEGIRNELIIDGRLYNITVTRIGFENYTCSLNLINNSGIYFDKYFEVDGNLFLRDIDKLCEMTGKLNLDIFKNKIVDFIFKNYVVCGDGFYRSDGNKFSKIESLSIPFVRDTRNLFIRSNL